MDQLDKPDRLAGGDGVGGEMEVAFCPVLSIGMAGGGHRRFPFLLDGCPFGEHSNLETLPELRKPVFSS